MEPTDILKENFQYYIENQVALFDQYPDKYLIIHNKQVVGAYDDQLTAYAEAVKRYDIGTFLLQHCTAGQDSYTQIFRSRTSFNKLFI